MGSKVADDNRMSAVQDERSKYEEINSDEINVKNNFCALYCFVDFGM